MADNNKNGQGPWVMTFLALFSGIIAIQSVSHLKASRPPTSTSQANNFNELEQIESRLWEDPFLALDRHLKTHGEKRKSISVALGNLEVDPKKGSENAPVSIYMKKIPEEEIGSRSINFPFRFRQKNTGEMWDQTRVKVYEEPKLLVLGVMFPGEKYFEESEVRRRRRYAILSALSTNNYSPVDATHIGYFDFKTDNRSKTLQVPYEWWEKDEAGILILWLNEGYFVSQTKGAQDTVENLARLQDEVLMGYENLKVSFKMIGPFVSGSLRKIILELNLKENQTDADPLKALKLPGRSWEFISPNATADEHVLLCGIELHKVIDGGIEEFYAGSENEDIEKMVLPCKIPSKKVKKVRNRDPDKTPEKDSEKNAEVKSAKTTTQEIVVPCDGFSDKAKKEDCWDKLLKRVKVSSYFPEISKGALNFIRVTPTDGDLAQKIWQELKLRCLGERGDVDCDPNHYNVAYISEWDTFYGRNLPNIFEEARKKGRGPDGISLKFSYMRGLDGQIHPTASAKLKKEDNADTKANLLDRGQLEKAEGNNQYDYLRRIGDDLKTINKLLFNQKDRERINAIGVLGSDIYDKLLVLQALKREFPNTIFFTTDLDARYIHSDQFYWTRNLIIGSGFGLRLNRAIQPFIPPFRDSYQTGNSLATLIAINNFERDCYTVEAITEAEDAGRKKEALYRKHRKARDCIQQEDITPWLDPLVFEIGRTRAHLVGKETPLKANLEGGPPQKLLFSSHPSNNWKEFHRATSLHPVTESIFFGKHTKFFVYPALSLLLLGLLLCFLSTTVRNIILSFPTLIFFSILTGVSMKVIGSIDSGYGEPLFLAEGISLWPSEFIRFITAFLTLYLIAYTYRSLKQNTKEIEGYFVPKRTADPPWRKSFRRRFRHFSYWKKIRVWIFRFFEYRFLYLPSNAGDKKRVKVEDAGSNKYWIREKTRIHPKKFWMQFYLLSSGPFRSSRTFIVTAFFFAFGFLLTRQWVPFIPYRGELSLWVDKGLLFMVVIPLFLWLIFLVADSATICRKFLTILASKPTQWSRETLCKLMSVNSVSDEEVEYYRDWADIKIIALQSEVIKTVIFFPFYIEILLIISRSTLFDAWTTPLSLILIFSICALVPVIVAGRLQREVERTRKRALGELNKVLIFVQERKPKHWAEIRERLTRMIEEVRDIKEGAFQPFTQQPVVRGLLLPFSSYGGVILTEYILF